MQHTNRISLLTKHKHSQLNAYTLIQLIKSIELCLYLFDLPYITPPQKQFPMSNHVLCLHYNKNDSLRLSKTLYYVDSK